jgi:hypothetical protein
MLNVNGKIHSQNTRAETYAENAVATSDTSWADIPNMQLTVNSGNADCSIQVVMGEVCVTANCGCRFRILMDGSPITRSFATATSAPYWGVITMARMILLSSGSHTISAQWQFVNTSGIGACQCWQARELSFIEL